MSRKELKDLAKKRIAPNILRLLPITIIFYIVPMMFSMFSWHKYMNELQNILMMQTKHMVAANYLTLNFLSTLSFGYSIFILLFFAGICKVFLRVLEKENEPVDSGEAFTFGASICGKSIWLAVIQSFFAMLWSFLFIVPGIIKGISYSMAHYILAENPNMTAREALRESKRLMDGHKMDFFVLMFSFFWWFVLDYIVLVGIFSYPYRQATYAAFYKEISKGMIETEEVTPEKVTPEDVTVLN